MTSKKLLKFYFRAGRLNDALDNLIMRSACASATGGNTVFYYADKIIEIVEAKRKLSELWKYLDGVMSSFNGEDKGILLGYALSRGGYNGLPKGRANAIRRVVVRFMRRAKNLSAYGEAVELVKRYYALTGR